MAVRVKVTTKGMEATLEDLAKMGQDVDAAVDEALNAGAQVILEGMQMRVPRDTGNLADHLSIDGPIQDGNYHYVWVGINRGTPGPTVRYGVVQEYGSHHTPAQPYIRPTVKEDMGKARRAIMEVLKRIGK